MALPSAPLALLLLALLATAAATADRQADLKTRSILPEQLLPITTAENHPSATFNSASVNQGSDRAAHERIASIREDSGVWSQITGACRTQLNRTLMALGRREAWAMAMYDASVKLPSGIEHGAVYQFGNFDECMAAELQQRPQEEQVIVSEERADDAESTVHGLVKPQYCLAKVRVAGYSVRTAAHRHFQLQNHTTIHWGVCLPAACSASDTAQLLAAWTGHPEVTVQPAHCHSSVEASSSTYSHLDVLVSCVFMGMLSMVVFCSGFHAIVWWGGGSKRHQRTGRRNCVEQIILSFSVIENMQKLSQASRDDLGLSAINGIKAISMIFIIAGHALLFMVGGPQLNTDFYAREIHLVQNAFLVNSPLLVDTFLLLSGFLFAHLVLVELEKREGRVNFGLLYVFRYVRLTPAYLAMIALYATWLPRLGTGPLWDERMQREQERCRSSWWINLLYVNNYVGTEQMCMFQSWYLAADTQLFVLAPLVVYPLWRWRRAGLTLLGAIAAISALIPFVSTMLYDTDPSLLPYSDEVEDITRNQYFLDWYIKTHMRATSYLFGILAGFLVHYIRDNDIKFSRSALWFLWLSTIAAGLASMLCIVEFFGVEQPLLARALYAGLHRLGWGYATGWIVLACALGYAGPLRSLLASRALVPLSRLTYCAYLTNGLVELYQAGSVRTPKYMSTVNMLGETLSHVFLTFLGALVLCLLFESPIHGLEKILLRPAAGGRPGVGGAVSQKTQRRSDSSSLGPSTESDST